MEEAALRKILSSTRNLDWFCFEFVKPVLWFTVLVLGCSMIQKPLLGFLLDWILLGLLMLLVALLQRVHSDIKAIQKRAKALFKKTKRNIYNCFLGEEEKNQSAQLGTKLRQEDESDDDVTVPVVVPKKEFNLRELRQEHELDASQQYEILFDQKDKELESLTTRVSQLELELETKGLEAEGVKAKAISLNKMCTEILDERKAFVDENYRIKKQLQSSEDKLKQVECERNNAEIRETAYKEVFRVCDRLMDEEVKKYQTWINQLSFDLKTKAKEATALRSQFGELQIEQGIVLDENKSLKDRLESSKARFKELESEFEAAVENVFVLKQQSGYDQLLEEKQDLELQLELKATEVKAAEANLNALVQQNTSLVRQLQLLNEAKSKDQIPQSQIGEEPEDWDFVPDLQGSSQKYIWRNLQMF